MTAGKSYRPLRPIEMRGLPPPSPHIGAKACLCWLRLDELVVDDRYQRSIADRGRLNILRIMAGFEWRKFTPVIVTPIEDGRYAIIDGQHRATAALMHPAIDQVPCMVVEVTPEEAASCFAAINGQVTAITPGQLFHARLAAGDPDAMALQGVLDAALVVVLKYKQPGRPYRVGETFAIGTLERCLKVYGRETLITALQSITQSGNGNAGCLTAPLIRCLCELLHEVGVWRDAGSRLLEAMDALNLFEFIADASAEAKQKRKPIAKVMKERLAAHLVAMLAPRIEATEPAQ